MKKIIYIPIFLLVFINSFTPAAGYDHEQKFYWAKCNLTWKVEGHASKKIARSQFKSISKINPNFSFKYTNSNPDILITSDKIDHKYMAVNELLVVDGKLYSSTIIINKHDIYDETTYMHEIIHSLGLYWDNHSFEKKSLMNLVGHKGQKITKKDKYTISNAFCGER